MRTGTAVIGIVFLVLSGLYLMVALRLPPTPAPGDAGPAELPRLIAAAGMLLSLALIGGALGGRGAPEGRTVAAAPLRGGAFVALSVAAAIALPHAGTVATLLVFTFAGVLIQAGRGALLPAAASAVIVTGLVYGVFIMLLDVPLP